MRSCVCLSICECEKCARFVGLCHCRRLALTRWVVVNSLFAVVDLILLIVDSLFAVVDLILLIVDSLFAVVDLILLTDSNCTLSSLVLRRSNSNNILYSSQREIKAVVRSHNEERISIILSHEPHAHTHS